MEMRAHKTGLPTYKHKGKDVFVAKITAIQNMITTPPQDPDARKLVFGELDKVSNLTGAWMRENKPEVGGYFVVSDTDDGVGKAEHIDSVRIDKDYVKDKK